jgi:hypothetical protein
VSRHLRANTAINRAIALVTVDVIEIRLYPTHTFTIVPGGKWRHRRMSLAASVFNGKRIFLRRRCRRECAVRSGIRRGWHAYNDPVLRLPDLYKILRGGSESNRRLAHPERENVYMVGRAADTLEDEYVLDMRK